jgi:hypothetical protein
MLPFPVLLRFVFALAVTLCIFSAAASAGPADELLGSWKLLSYTLEYVDDGTKKDVYGVNPKGYYLFTKDRLMVLLTPLERKTPASQSEAAEMLNTMTAYTARYKVDDEKFVFTPDVSHNEFYVGKEQIRYYKIVGDRLSVTTPVIAPANAPEKRVISHVEFIRE